MKNILEWIAIAAVWAIPFVLWRMKKQNDRRRFEQFRKDATGMIESARQEARAFRPRTPHSAENGNDAKD